MCTMNAEPISAEALAELRTLQEEGAPDIVAELIGLFVQSTPPLLSDAHAATAEPHRLRVIAHTIKGSCGHFGATRLEALCQELECVGLRGESSRAAEMVREIEEEFGRVRAALGQFLA